MTATRTILALLGAVTAAYATYALSHANMIVGLACTVLAACMWTVAYKSDLN